ncbi:FAD binding domain-containing protein [Rubinisphaera margarita]|uniref:FAD binding domain-containing protein n=1 Tax=Rubinisphaera margarita TaxID=2909586 RepID=UPI001EE85EF7|nr:FAD binding domain-containing protein [Rubinisphaera margarita]MCG6156489.1 FAD binding domain-containing protein [Rubinisphaera margarita]
MIPFEFASPKTLSEASREVDHKSNMALAGGTTLLDLMKLNVLTPNRVVSIAPVLGKEVRLERDTLTIEAGCTMAKLADHEAIRDAFPVIRQSLITAASPQIRNMATIGGNLLQRTRSTYFRHPDMAPPEQSFEAETEEKFWHRVDLSSAAVLGNNGRVVGTYPGDFANTVVAFDGTVHLQGPDNTRTVKARDFYRKPSEKEIQYSVDLKPGELIAAISLPVTPALKQSLYFKVRERSSYAFALASVAAGLELEGEGASATIRHAHVAFGGLGSIPWYSSAAVLALEGEPATDENFEKAAQTALAEAAPPPGNEYRVRLAERSLVRSLRRLRDVGPYTDAEIWAMQHGRAVNQS